MRLIDADALKKVLKENEWLTDDPFTNLGGLEELIDNAPTVEEKPFEINVFLENADESTLFDIKKELAQILTDRAEREAYEEARREAMRLDDNEDTLKWKGTH